MVYFSKLQEDLNTFYTGQVNFEEIGEVTERGLNIRKLNFL